MKGVRKLRIPILSNWLDREIRSAATTMLSNPDPWLNEAFGSAPTNAGESVNEHNALHVATVFACVRIIAETIASLPVHIYKRLDTGGKEKSSQHPLYSLLHDEPNEEMSAYSFWETLAGHLLTWGNAYAEIERNGMGRIVALWPLRPDLTHPERSTRDKKIYYRTIIPERNQQVVLPAEKVLHIPGFGYDGRVGYSIIRMAREAIGMAVATEKYGAKFFGNGAKPGGVLEHPNKLKDNETVNRLRSQWDEIHRGLDKAHRIAILEEGMTYKQIGLPPEDSQFLETRKFQKHEIAQLFRVPLHMLADLDRATFSNIEHQSIEFVVHTIRPWLVRIEQEVRRKLLNSTEKKSHFAEFLVDGLLRGDIKSRYEAYQIAIQNGWLNRDEIREMENQNPIEGGLGQKYTVNAATILLADTKPAGEGGDNGAGQGTAVDPSTGKPA